ncbi:rhodanese-like domain-containing protein [Nitrosomonas ureae]|uniref:Rhodanese-related sulfurtransferase n=1 Tax=Nitrosomonas ureae TaxID=44577 RepID=A0A1H5XH65_9PROT|nr:rhodanese-like domain-containing protein [Nitrosomonas ureae]SEG10815.1 Rhodanese-related sulfurtransferase [Nitrosomonas ureae]
MRKILVALLIALFSIVTISKADSLSPERVEGARTVSTETAKLLFDKGYLFLDVRSLNDYRTGHIPGAYHLSVRSDFDEQKLSVIVKKDQPVVMYCNGTSCLGSSIAIEKAVEWGWKNIFYYREGIKDWNSKGYPVFAIEP